MKPLYRTYLFRRKDPVIDLLRTAIQLEAHARNISFNKMLGVIVEDCGGKPTIAALHNWFSGPTISPRYCHVAAVANSIRASWRVGDFELSKPGRPKLRLVG
jgi:hypothetical protein